MHDYVHDVVAFDRADFRVAALARIEESSFGVCLCCEEEINPKRLAAVPWTAFCIQCQEIADRRQSDRPDNFDDFLINAA